MQVHIVLVVQILADEKLVADLAQAPLQLALPCSAFLVPTPISPDGFTSLLSSHNWHSASAR